MNYLISTEDITYIISDITAGVFLTVLVISTITHQAARRPGFTHLFAATMLILAGIFTRFFALMMGLLPEGIEWNLGMDIQLPRSADVIWIMSFILISVGICESVVHAVYINEGMNRTVFRPVFLMSGIIIAAGIIAYAFAHSITAFTLAILVQLLCLNIYLYRSRYERACYQFRRASIIAIATFIIALIVDSVRLTGLGLSLMLIILNEQYHERIGQELAENEAALAKSKLQLLTEQISPHYIYNSLQSIRDLCGTDPEKARDAVDAFSDYLRGNLESLTREELIPFTRELEHTQSYLELEKIAGRRKFDVEYSLETVDFMLPPLVLQPLVENAVQHGSGNGSEGVIITIATCEAEGAVCIEVTDRPEQIDGGLRESKSSAVESSDFVAGENAKISAHKVNIDNELPEITNKGKKRQNIGLENVRTRLAIQCGGTLEIDSCEGGTKVKIVLPNPQKTIPVKNLEDTIYRSF